MRYSLTFSGLLYILLLILSCIEEQADTAESLHLFCENHTPFQTKFNPFNLPFSEKFEFSSLSIGEVNMTEASGMA